MFPKLNNKFDFWLAYIYATICYGVFLIWALPLKIWHLNTAFLCTHFDGVKNYFTYLSYLKNDSGFLFSSMAYPYKEVISFTDNQPLLALAVKYLNTLGLPLASVSLGIFNALLLIAFPFAVAFVFVIIRHFGVRKVWAFFIALSIIFLAPQNDRLFGHFALSYAFVIPILWYLEIKMNAKITSWKYPIIAILFLFLMGLVHVYYLAIGLFFYLFIFAARLLLDDNKADFLRKGNYKFLLVALLPVILFKIVLAFIDTKTDRVQFPYGFLNYRATYRSIFFNEESPLDFIYPSFLQMGKFEAEGRAYLGFFALIFILFYLFKIVHKWRSMKVFNADTFNILDTPSYIHYLIASFFTLVLASAFPIYMQPLDSFVEYIPVLPQFRSVGRFAWIFYYFFSVFAFLYFYQLHYHHEARLQKLVLPLVLAFSLFEGVWMLKVKMAKVNVSNTDEVFLAANKSIGQLYLNRGNYQSIIAFPFYTIGDEKEGYSGTDESILNSMSLSYHTGIPLTNYMMSRTSVSEGAQITALMSHAILDKEYFRLIDPNLPFLLMVVRQKLSEAEKALINLAEPIAQFSDFELYKLYPKSIITSQANHLKVLEGDWYQGLFNNQLFTRKPSTSSFQTLAGAGLNSLFSNQSEVFKLNGEELLFNGFLKCKDSLLVSVWVRSKDFIYGFPRLQVKTSNGAKQDITIDGLTGVYNESYRGTRRISTWLKLPKEGAQLKISLQGLHFAYANFVLKESNEDYMFRDSLGNSFWNNYPIPKGLAVNILEQQAINP
jgi:hypothetical protein